VAGYALYRCQRWPTRRQSHCRQGPRVQGSSRRGWPGDVSKVSLDNSKIKKLGYKFFVPDSTTACKLGVKQIIDYLEKNRR
jgi:hypothetical protein